LPDAAQVLDYGCGIGVELRWMQRQGLRVEGVDGTAAFVAQARRRCPGARIRCARFETIQLPRGRYDGVWCNAALIHVPPDELQRQLQKLRAALKPSGRLALTLAWGRATRRSSRDWIPGRYLASYTMSEVAAMLHGWRLLDLRAVSNDGRAGRWLQLLAAPR
jgi:2-polyprenyl-3-methyl-5-hydroxy-6-metoxy-1,4-benzoquinol methylase